MRTYLARVLAVIAVLFALAAAGAQSRGIDESAAFLIHLTGDDLNAIVRRTFAARGAGRLDGVRDDPSKGIRDMEYSARLSRPTLAIDDDGRIRVRVDILEGSLRIGELERKILSRTTRCEELGVFVEAGQPVELALDIRLVVEDGNLRVIPEAVEIGDDGRALQLKKPDRCTQAVLPTWLLWWLGKPHLKRQLGQFDSVLLDRAGNVASALNEDDGLLRKRWSVRSAGHPDRGGDVVLSPELVDTDDGSLLISLGAQIGSGSRATPVLPAWTVTLAGQSYLGISETFLNALIHARLDGARERVYRPQGDARRLFKSEALLALIPGLRELDPDDRVHFTTRMPRTPDIAFGTLSVATPVRDGSILDNRAATLNVTLDDVEIGVWSTRGAATRRLGTLTVDRARVGVVPYSGVLGGVSFAVIENTWRLSSTGLEVNDALFAATLQEIVFGEVFETEFNPVARNAFDLGDEAMQASFFRRLGRHFVVGFSVPEAEPVALRRAPTRTDSLRASR